MGRLKKIEQLGDGFALPKPPARTTVNEAAAARLEASLEGVEPGTADLESGRAQTKQASGAPKRRKKRSSVDSDEEPKSRLRRDGGGERVNVYMPPTLVSRLRVQCALDRRSLSDAVTAAVEAWLSDQPSPRI